jgi:hypothetical protein
MRRGGFFPLFVRRHHFPPFLRGLVFVVAVVSSSVVAHAAVQAMPRERGPFPLSTTTTIENNNNNNNIFALFLTLL